MRKQVIARTGLLKRAESVKGLQEQRAALLEEMKELTGNAETEKRAMSKEENEKFDLLEGKIVAIDETMKRAEKVKDSELTETEEEEEGDKPKGNKSGEKTKNEEQEKRAFENYIRKEIGMPLIETRAGEQNITMGNNGAVIPSTIASRIIEKVKEICPIFEKSTMYAVKGTLKVPVWGAADGHNITVSYQEEFTEITEDSGKFTSIDLSGYLAGALTLIGKSVANNATIDIVSFIVTQMSKEIAIFLEKELLIGTEGKATGALSTETTLITASATAITADELVRMQAQIKQVYQKDACWTMNVDTFTCIKTLKDGNGRYLLQDDYSSEFPYRLLGKPVNLSDNMPAMQAGKKAILYGDYSGLSVNMRENVEIQVLLEKYATKHAIGVVSWFEFDSKVTDHQKLVTLQMKTA